MLARHTKSEVAEWKVTDIYARSESKTCWVIWVDGARYVPGDCSDCGGDTLVDLNTRREDDGDCARCGAKGASIYYEGCRDSLTLLHFVAVALFGEAPSETLECECCKRVLELQHFRLDGNDVCSWCTSEAELRQLRKFVARAEAGITRGTTVAMFDRAENRIDELQAELAALPVRK